MHLKSPCCMHEMEVESLCLAIFRCLNCRRSWRNNELIAGIDLRNPKSPYRLDQPKPDTNSDAR